MDKADLAKRFEYHAPPNEAVKEAHWFIRKQMQGAAEVVFDQTPDCGERFMALEKLEEAMFWANAAIARNHEHYTSTTRRPPMADPNLPDRMRSQLEAAKLAEGMPPGHIQQEQSIAISPEELPGIQRFLEQLRAKKAMEAEPAQPGEGAWKLAHGFLRMQLRLIRQRANAFDPEDYEDPGLLLQDVLAILDEHIQALE